MNTIIPIHPMDVWAVLGANDGPIDLIKTVSKTDNKTEIIKIWGQEYFQTIDVPILTSEGRKQAFELGMPLPEGQGI